MKNVEPLLKLVLEEEKKNFHSDLESWEAHEAKIRLEIESMVETYQQRLLHACDLIQKRFS